MKVIYIQDQVTGYFEGDYYHPKSEHFYERYLAGLSNDESLTVYCGISSIKNREIALKYKKVTNPRIKFVQLPGFKKVWNYFKAKKIIKKAIEKADFCYMRCGIAASIAGYYCRKKGVPYMAILNEDVFKNLWTHPQRLYRIAAYPLYWMTYGLVKNANYACYVTQNYLQSQYPCKGESCGCSDVEHLEFNNSVLDRRIKHIEELCNTIKLGSVGSVSAKLKGQDTVIKTLAYLKKRGINNYRYELVGTGDPKNLKDLAKKLGVEEMIDFKGVYSHDDVLNWFETIDIYIHPSHSEGLPRTILEAMAKATPCICTKVGGVPELINEEFLFSYNGNEIEDLSVLLQKMDKDNMIKEAMANFEHSKDYAPAILEERRARFFEGAILQVKKQL